MRNTEQKNSNDSSPIADTAPTDCRGNGSQSEAQVYIGKLFTAAEAADVLGFRRRNTVYEIPERDLPRTRVGPRRGRTMFRGEDLLAYIIAGRNGS